MKNRSEYPRNHSRFGLGRQAVLTGCLFVAGLIAATVLAHLIQWELAESARQATDCDAPRFLLASQIIQAAARCGQWHKDFEVGFDQEGARRSAVDAWNSAYAELEQLLDALAASDGCPEDRSRIDDWRALGRRYRAAFEDVVRRIEAGEQVNRSGVHHAMAACDSAAERLSAEAQAFAGVQLAKAQSSAAEFHRVVGSRAHLIDVRAVVGILALALAVSWFRRNVLRRLKALSAAALRFASGDLGVRLEVGSQDELGTLAQHFNEMASAVQTSCQQLRDAKTAAQSVSQAKSEFLASLSQEMRVPLTVISVHADMLRAHRDNPEILEAASTVSHHGEYLLEVVNDIFDLSRMEMGELRVEQTRCSPSGIVAEVASMLQARADAKGLDWLAEFPTPIPETIHTDPVRLRQILLNLAGHAIKVTEIGKVRLVMRLLDSGSAAPKLQFEVVNTGIGMTEEQTARLFAPLPSDEALAGHKAPGGSLGLTICKRLVTMLGGTITAASQPGMGSTLTLTIPTGPLDGIPMVAGSCRLPPPPWTGLTPISEPRETSRVRILLAEDGPENRRLMSFILQKAGVDVVIAENGREAVKKALGERRPAEGAHANEPFDLILMDMQMPVMDGYEATRRLRQSGYTGLIIAVTGHTTSYDRQKCLDAGCNDYLTKPIDRERLLSTLTGHVACRQGHRSPPVPAKASG